VASEVKPPLFWVQEQLEAALELTRQQLGQATREVVAPGRAWGRQRLLQDRLVSVRATLCHLAQVSIWKGTGGARLVQMVMKLRVHRKVVLENSIHPQF
jgi:hypothetical protein